MKIKNIRKFIMELESDGKHPTTIEGKKIKFNENSVEKTFKIGKENLDMIFEEAKAAVNNDYWVSDFLKHDQIKYFETHDGDCYIIGFDVEAQRVSGGAVLNFYQRTSIPALDILQNYNLITKLEQEVGAQ